MKILVTVVPGSSEEDVSPQADGSYRVRVKARAREGEANEALVRALARHFGVPQRDVEIRTGHGSRRKIVEVG